MRSAAGLRAMAMRPNKNAARLAASEKYVAELRRSKLDALSEHNLAQRNAAQARKGVKRNAQSAKWTNPVFLVTAQLKHPKLMANAKRLLEKRKLNNAANRQLEARLSKP